jgi:hypothetical protein
MLPEIAPPNSNHIPDGTFTWLPYVQAIDPTNSQSRYAILEVVGNNIGKEEITLEDAYVVSGVTGAKTTLKVDVHTGKPAAIADINPIPPGAFFYSVHRTECAERDYG